MFEILHEMIRSSRVRRVVPVTETDFQVSKVHFNLLRILTTIARFLGFAPYYVDTTIGKLSFYSGVCHGRCIHNWLWMTAYAIIVLPTHAIQLHMASDSILSIRSNKTIIYLVLGMLFCCIVTIIMGTLVLNPTPICQIMNCILKYIEKFPVKYMPTYDPFQERIKMLSLEVFMVATIGGILFVLSFIIIHCFLHPTTLAYPAFSVPSQFLFLPVYLLSCSWFCLSAFGSVLTILSILITVELYLFYFLPVIQKELRLGRVRYKTHSMLREPYHLVLNWRALQVFVTTFNIEMGFVISPVQSILLAMVLVCNVSIVFQWHLFRFTTKILLIGAGLLIPTIWCFILYMAGQQYLASIKTKESWKLENWEGIKDRKYISRFRRSCRSLGAGDGGSLVVTPVMVLQFADSLSQNTFRAFITYVELFEA
ncbi:unnamed protein product [Orchesella dallaii]|uniref:Odorant receptor n=1 Tax=Orchesella dallaii TaxID=48710 RepID=A0ABP1S473_9HEXA